LQRVLKSGAALAFICAWSPPLLAQTMSPEHQEQQKRLESLRGEIGALEKQTQSLEGQKGKVTQELSDLRGRLVRTANQIQETEEKTTAIEGRVAELNAKTQAQETALSTRRQDIAVTLAALQRLSRQPPALVLIRPDEAVATARSAQLLATVVPALRLEAEALSQDLKLLHQLRTELAAERRTLEKSLAALEEERRNMNALLATRQEEYARLERETAAERARLKRFAAEAQSLEALISKVEEELARRRAAAADAAERLAKRPDIPKPKTAAPAPSISAAMGGLPMPVRGSLVRRFGEPDEAGNAAKGITIEARPQAQVVAPFDGRVVFAGPFRNYGQILIIAHGEGYHSLLAGMARVTAVVGQTVTAGEPVGQMGDGIDAGSSSPRTRLYVELRSDGKPMNPVQWLAARKGKVSG
jgi:septal ring factor EnvC (AmiA/AmiB activator)